MPPIETLDDLFVHQLRDIYSAERQLVAALPKMARNATSQDLKDAFTTHLEQTEEQVNRLQQVFEQLGVSSRGPKCKAMEGLVEEGKEIAEEDITPEMLDAGLIAAAQRVEHYEIAAYGTVCEYARALGHDEILTLLQSTLDEEKETDRLLTTLAVTGIEELDLANDEEESEDADDSEEESSSVAVKKTRAPSKAATRAPGKPADRKVASASSKSTKKGARSR